MNMNIYWYAGFSNAYTKTQLAVFLPTPGNCTKVSRSSGTLFLYFLCIIFETSIILFDFT